MQQATKHFSPECEFNQLMLTPCRIINACSSRVGHQPVLAGPQITSLTGGCESSSQVEERAGTFCKVSNMCRANGRNPPAGKSSNKPNALKKASCDASALIYSAHCALLRGAVLAFAFAFDFAFALAPGSPRGMNGLIRLMTKTIYGADAAGTKTMYGDDAVGSQAWLGSPRPGIQMP